MKNLIQIPTERIIGRIFYIRGKKVMFDSDLAKLYGVETRVLNKERFPEDFMFQINKEEFKIWKSQIVISKSKKMGLRKLPLVFTEEGVAMLSSVLKSDKAIQINIQIIRTFSKIREMVSSNKELREKIEKLERKYEGHDKKFAAVFDAMRDLFTEKAKPKNEIGFNTK
jgi:hypothetical protein